MSAPVDVMAVLRSDANEALMFREGSCGPQYVARKTRESDSAIAALKELIEAAKRIAEYADDDYVPNVAFARLIQALAAVGGAK